MRVFLQFQTRPNVTSGYTEAGNFWLLEQAAAVGRTVEVNGNGPYAIEKIVWVTQPNATGGVEAYVYCLETG